MAELAAVPRSACIPIPDGLSGVQATGIANPGMLVWFSIKQRAELKAGNTVLILGATGVARIDIYSSGAASGSQARNWGGAHVESLKDSGLDAVIALGESKDAVRAALAEQVEQGVDVLSTISGVVRQSC